MIISPAVQVAEILDKEIDKVRTAREMIQHIAVELRATAYGLTTLQIVLNEVMKASNDRLFSDEHHRNTNPVLWQNDKIFGQIFVSSRKIGRVDPIDQHQCRLQSGGTAVIPYSTLTFSFSIPGRLMWQFKSREILQSIAESN